MDKLAHILLFIYMYTTMESQQKNITFPIVEHCCIYHQVTVVTRALISQSKSYYAVSHLTVENT